MAASPLKEPREMSQFWMPTILIGAESNPAPNTSAAVRAFFLILACHSGWCGRSREQKQTLVPVARLACWRPPLPAGERVAVLAGDGELALVAGRLEDAQAGRLAQPAEVRRNQVPLNRGVRQPKRCLAL